MGGAIARLFVAFASAGLIVGCATTTITKTETTVEAEGEIKGTAWKHDAHSTAKLVEDGILVLPKTVNGGIGFNGKFKNMPSQLSAQLQNDKVRAPMVVFMHGSSGLGLKAIGEWQAWLAEQGVASFAPDSFALPSRVTYKSPIDKASYEKIHDLRLSEIVASTQAVKNWPWVNPRKLILAGTSEGAVAVSRYDGQEYIGKIIYSWSCENNYFVSEPHAKFGQNQAVLNVMSMSDQYFSMSNSFIGNADAIGHCGAVLSGLKNASVVLIAKAPHTLLTLPMTKAATLIFLSEVLK